MLDFDPAAVAIPAGHFIDGRVVVGEGETIGVRRPSDGALYADLPIASADLVDRAVTGAAEAQRRTDWATRAPRERARVLRRFADLIDARTQELGRLEALGSTRPIAQALAVDVASTAEGFRFFAEYADKLGGEVAATRSDSLGLVISEPYGVVAAITPWNFPLSMASWKAGPALAAGNAVVLKPSELTPFSTVLLAQLAVEAGVPPGIFNVVQGTGFVTGDALCRHPRVGKISFTGSTRTGAAIMAASAASGVKPVTLELGGKSPQLVFADTPSADRPGDAGGAPAAGRHRLGQPLRPHGRLHPADRRLQALRHRQGPRAPGGRGQSAPQERADGVLTELEPPSPRPDSAGAQKNRHREEAQRSNPGAAGLLRCVCSDDSPIGKRASFLKILLHAAGRTDYALPSGRQRPRLQPRNADDDPRLLDRNLSAARRRQGFAARPRLPLRRWRL
ncbi:aldehyde dehydrogenase family protein [Inquilinus sp. CA228]|uniref:aldehyde dehydrogenase family protein n=1 Tax=Inquilinus sp. CA228 TaxID=3455609 RepID=UPI003F8D696E